MKIRTQLLSCLLVVSIAGIAVATAQEHKQPMPEKSAAPSEQLHQIMHDGASQSMKMSGDVDRDFAAMMIMHHEQALKMVEVELQHGDNAELKAMAEKMKAAQKKDIQELARFK